MPPYPFEQSGSRDELDSALQEFRQAVGDFATTVQERHRRSLPPEPMQPKNPDAGPAYIERGNESGAGTDNRLAAPTQDRTSELQPSASDAGQRVAPVRQTPAPKPEPAGWALRLKRRIVGAVKKVLHSFRTY